MISIKKVYLFFLCICILQVSIAGPVSADESTSATGLVRNNFFRISMGGFGDSANSYAWSGAVFKGDLYVGVNRHHLWSVMEGMKSQFSFLEPELLINGPVSAFWGDYQWADDFCGEIWRYRAGKWSMVHKASILEGLLPILSNPLLASTPRIEGYYPESSGYRNMTVFNGYIYTIGIGTWYPSMPVARILRSCTGDPGSWEDVSGIIASTTNPRGLVQYLGNLYITASLPGVSPTGAGAGIVYRFDPRSAGLWKQVSDPGFGNLSNTEIPCLTVFNNCLYASTVNRETGFEVWKTDGTIFSGDRLAWKRVIKEGFGDTWNQWGMTMAPYKGYLYIGTATDCGMVLKNGLPVGSRAFDVIRLDTNDQAQLVVGAYKASDPLSGWPVQRTPLSGWPAGFANPFNMYVWDMCVHDGWLYLGTYDETSCIILYAVQILKQIQYNPSVFNINRATLENIRTIISTISSSSITQAEKDLILKLQAALGSSDLKSAQYYVSLIMKTYGGADLWKTNDGIHWTSVTTNGFDNYLNFGFRRLIPVSDSYVKGLIVGTANAFSGLNGGGCEVLFGR